MYIDWSQGKEVLAPINPLPRKLCAGEGCSVWFVPKWHTARRCQNCKKNKVPYKQEQTNDSPF